jgi:hypothetical protein
MRKVPECFGELKMFAAALLLQGNILSDGLYLLKLPIDLHYVRVLMAVAFPRNSFVRQFKFLKIANGFTGNGLFEP